jgi:hypothetical protein
MAYSEDFRKKVLEIMKIESLTAYQASQRFKRLFGRLKENKRIAMRFDKLDVVFSSFIALELIKSYHLLC